jgi:hypothetical protein
MRTRALKTTTFALAIALLVSVATPASASGTLSLTGISCGGSAKVRINSTGYGGGFHTLYLSPSSSKSRSFTGALSPATEKRTFFALDAYMAYGYATRDTSIISAYRDCSLS